MALIKYFILVTLLASYGNAQSCTTNAECMTPPSGDICEDDGNCNCQNTHVKVVSSCLVASVVAATCTGDADCSNAALDSCETLTDSSSSRRCSCADNYVRVDNNCIVSRLGCGENSDCTNLPFGDTCESGTCNCGVGYSKSGDECRVKPAQPTLTLAGAATAFGNLLRGESYTLTCLSTGAPGDVPYTYQFMRDSTTLLNGNLANVDDTAAGTYRCTATYDGVTSDDSTTLTYEVIAQTVAAVTCANNAACEAEDTVGDTCETLSVGGTQECNCAANYARVGGNCEVSNLYCEDDGDCSEAPFGGTCTTNACDCATGYEKVDSQCKVKPAQPTLTIQDGTPPDSLISGTTYTLVCASAGAPGNIPYTYVFLKGDDVLDSATLTTVTQEANGGNYKCRATYDGVASDDSAVANIEVKVQPAKPTLSEQGGTPLTDLSEGGSYTLVCTSANPPAGTTYTFSRNGDDISATLTSVSTGANAGSYTCVATADGIASETSDPITVAVNAAGRYCASASACSGSSFSGVCTSSRCVCATGYEVSGTNCIAAGKTCSDSGDCGGDEFTGDCTSGSCVCAVSYVETTTGCDVPPAQPTLTLDGDNEATDLSEGATYTLVCASAGAPAGTIYVFRQGTSELSSGSLTSVTSSHDGSYICYAVSANGAQSQLSTALAITVGVAGKRCTSNDDCTAGEGFTGTCETNRCTCTSSHRASGETCSLAVHTATISLFSIVLAFMISKLL